MSVLFHLDLAPEAGGADDVATVLHEIISGSLAEDFAVTDLLEGIVVLVSGLIVDVGPGLARDQPVSADIEGHTVDLDLPRAVCVSFQPYKARQVGAFDKYGEFPEYPAQHKDALCVVIELLRRIPGDALLHYEASPQPWLLRHAGHLYINQLIGWAPELLDEIPTPHAWTPIRFR